jgi:hypothetical protein
MNYSNLSTDLDEFIPISQDQIGSGNLNGYESGSGYGFGNGDGFGKGSGNESRYSSGYGFGFGYDSEYGFEVYLGWTR